MPLPPSNLSCHCRAITLPLPLLTPPTTTFPISTELCHCNTCRHTTGAISGSFIELLPLSSPDFPHDLINSALSKCTEYASSSKVSRFFCATCGAHILLRGWSTTDPVVWYAWAGAIEYALPDGGDREDVIQVDVQAYVDDTLDGGLVGRMVEVAERDGQGQGVESCALLKTVFADIFEGPVMTADELKGLVAVRERKGADVRRADKLLVECHCASVRFWITRPRPEEEYHEEVGFYLKGEKDKYLARICTCRSCRAATGNTLMLWTYIPPENIVTDEMEAIEFGSGKDSLSQLGGAIKKYVGENGAIRSFCGTCGATVFYEHDERGWVVDIAVGILRSHSGAMAEDFLEWDFSDVSYEEECTSKKLLDGLVEKKSVE